MHYFTRTSLIVLGHSGGVVDNRLLEILITRAPDVETVNSGDDTHDFGDGGLSLVIVRSGLVVIHNAGDDDGGEGENHRGLD